MIVNEIKSQPFCPYFGYQCDEVTDSSNWEQLGVIIHYTVNGTPVDVPHNSSDNRQGQSTTIVPVITSI